MGSEAQILAPLAGLEFVKMTGTGNDFILLDHRQAQVPAGLRSLLARAVCCRRRSVGADGLILLTPSERVDPRWGRVDFVWDFFNADGSSAEMCGNGGRCAARFAHDRGLAGPEMVFDTLAGPIRAQVRGEVVKLEMVPPSGAYAGIRLALGDQEVVLEGINTGVPHAVVRVTDLAAAPVVEWGRQIRYHDHFQPAGTNVNFVQAGPEGLRVRTYERGVEDETLACGTGAVASALMSAAAAGLASPVRVQVASGESLTIHFRSEGEGFQDVFLEGSASYVYHGVLHQEAFAWLAN
ncbi:MAG: diaminopimelate epimerase [Deltaproteobacteria bacterium]|nr:diaminopimelate epimerase [Deltaproteobacteria bacterium]